MKIDCPLCGKGKVEIEKSKLKQIEREKVVLAYHKIGMPYREIAQKVGYKNLASVYKIIKADKND